MSGIVSGMDYSMLFSGGSSATSGLLGALYGGPSTAGGGVSGVDPLTALTLAQTNKTADIATEAKSATVARDIAAFKKGVANAKDITAALQNPNVLKVLLTANGLGSQTGFAALAQKALMSDPSDPKSLASQLSSTNTAWLSVAQTYNFAKNGLAELQNPKVQAALTSGYAQTLWEQSLDQQTPGLSSAMQFQSNAASIKNVDQILGDPVSRDVVLTALNIPLQIAYQSIAAQGQAVSSLLDITKLQDPHYVQTLTQQYLLNKAQSAQATSSSSDLTSLAAQAGGILA
jgi:hypothetical protein